MTVEIKFYNSSIWPQKRLYRTRFMNDHTEVIPFMKKDDVPAYIDGLLKNNGWKAARIRGKMHIVTEYPPEYDEVLAKMDELWEKSANAIMDFMEYQGWGLCDECEYRRE